MVVVSAAIGLTQVSWTHSNVIASVPTQIRRSLERLINTASWLAYSNGTPASHMHFAPTRQCMSLMTGHFLLGTTQAR
jgi:hypothetical protein